MRHESSDDATTPAAKATPPSVPHHLGSLSPVGIDAPILEGDMGLATLKDAAPLLGYPTADALRRAFARGLLPGRFLIRLGVRTRRVDVAAVLAYVRQNAADSEGGLGGEKGAPR